MEFEAASSYYKPRVVPPAAGQARRGGRKGKGEKQLPSPGGGAWLLLKKLFGAGKKRLAKSKPRNCLPPCSRLVAVQILVNQSGTGGGEGRSPIPSYPDACPRGRGHACSLRASFAPGAGGGDAPGSLVRAPDGVGWGGGQSKGSCRGSSPAGKAWGEGRQAGRHQESPVCLL